MKSWSVVVIFSSFRFKAYFLFMLKCVSTVQISTILNLSSSYLSQVLLFIIMEKYCCVSPFYEWCLPKLAFRVLVKCEVCQCRYLDKESY